MSEQQQKLVKSVDIDALLQNTWLQVISLRHEPLFKEGEGRILWEHCVEDVEQVQQVLKESGLDDENCQHILTAQCALLDEAVKSRGVDDDACVQWYGVPLQGHFMGSMDAGETLCDRMFEVLHEPAPNTAVITCFHRVMMLGFLGSFHSLTDPKRQKLLKLLSEHAKPFHYPQTQPVLAKSNADLELLRLFSSWPMRLGVSVIILIALWWGLNSWLDQMLTTLLPEAVK